MAVCRGRQVTASPPTGVAGLASSSPRPTVSNVNCECASCTRISLACANAVCQAGWGGVGEPWWRGQAERCCTHVHVHRRAKVRRGANYDPTGHTVKAQTKGTGGVL